MAGNLFAVRERARESANALMMVTGSEQSVLLMMESGHGMICFCALIWFRNPIPTLSGELAPNFE